MSPSQRTRIRSLSLVNFRGIFFKTLNLHHLMSNLIGHNGAGKTTIMGALLINRVPDNRLVRLRNNSDSASDRSDNGIYGRIEAGTCYSLVDYNLYDGRRVIAGVQLRRLAAPRVELKRFAITGIDPDMPVRDLVMEAVDNNLFEPLDGKALRNRIARLGGTVETYDNVAHYMRWQFDCRIIPRAMENSGDRQRYYRMLETSLYGGLSAELQKGLRDYLLPADDQVKRSVSSMQNALMETRKTRVKIEATREKRQFIQRILNDSYALGEQVLALSAQEHRKQNDRLDAARSTASRLEHDRESARQQTQGLQDQLDRMDEERDQLDQDLQTASNTLSQAKDLTRLHQEQAQLDNELVNIRSRLTEKRQEYTLFEAQRQEQTAAQSLLEEDLESLVNQLASAEDAYSEEARKAGLYQDAIRSLDESRAVCGDDSLSADSLPHLLAQLRHQRDAESEQLHERSPLLEQAEMIREHFSVALPIIQRLDASDITPAQVAERTAFWLRHWRTQKDLASSQEQHKQHLKHLEKNRQTREQLLSAIEQLPEAWCTLLTNEESWQTTREQANVALQESRAQLEVQQETLDQLSDNHRRLRLQMDQAQRDRQAWLQATELAGEIARLQPEARLDGRDQLHALRQTLNDQRDQCGQRDSVITHALDTVRQQLRGLDQDDSDERNQLHRLADLTGGTLVSDYLDSDDISLDEAAYLEAKFGPLRQALLVPDAERAATLIRQEADRPDDVWLLQGKPGEAFSEEDYLRSPDDQSEEDDGSVFVHLADRIARISREPEFPTLGRLAREQAFKRLTEQEQTLLDERQTLAVNRHTISRIQGLLDELAPMSVWLGIDEPPVSALQTQLETLAHQQQSQQQVISANKQEVSNLQKVCNTLDIWQTSASLLTENDLDDAIEMATIALTESLTAQSWITNNQADMQSLEQRQFYLQTPPPDDIDKLRDELNQLQASISHLGRVISLLASTADKLPNLRFAASVERKDASGSLRDTLREEHKQKSAQHKTGKQTLELTIAQCNDLNTAIRSDESRQHDKEGAHLLKSQEIREIPLTWRENLVSHCEEQFGQLRKQVRGHEDKRRQFTDTLAETRSTLKQLELQHQDAEAQIARLKPAAEAATASWQAISTTAESSGLARRLRREGLLATESEQLKSGIADARASLIQALAVEQENPLRQALETTALHDLAQLFHCVVDAQHFLAERMDQTLVNAEDPRQALEQLEHQLTRLETRLKDAESRFLAESDRMGQHIERSINRERKQIHQLNSALSSVHFGTIRAIKVELEVIDSFRKVLEALQQRFYPDLFNQPDMKIEDALAEIFKKETGGSIAGEKLLDYREYIKLQVLVQRANHKQFEPANPTNLSTGEAIGTGLAVLTMVLHSWEVTTHKRVGHGHSANRLLFLDEAARLDARALATLEELCANQSLQLLVGAPDNVLPKNGVTYRMVRLMEPYEHVIFSAVRGKMPSVSMPKEETAGAEA
ncbi:chromosome partition protein MukB [Kistimonas scapharcae]|uniref:Chromosome partition protein MukB n=1 Tax=Kistimonas scapharcae TaxID=1036133 RepID=A0ABP8V3Z5_9GAMM